MLRNLLASITVLAFLVAAGHAAQDGDTLLDKKSSLTDKDPGYKPGAGYDKLTENFAPQIFMAITNNPHQVFTVKVKKGDKIVVSMKSADFDSVVVVEDSKKNVLTFNDDDPDGGGTLDSRLVWTATADDELRIIATCLDMKTGAFQLTVSKAK